MTTIDTKSSASARWSPSLSWRERGAVLICVLLSLSPIWAGSILPGVDYPQNVFAAHVLSRLASGDSEYAEIYATRFSATGFTFHRVVAALDLFTGDPDLACRLYLSVLIVMLVAGLAVYCRALGRSRLPALLVPGLLYGSAIFSWGLLNFFSVLPALFTAAAFLVHVLAGDRGWYRLGLGVSLVFMAITHVLGFVPFAVMAIVLTATHERPDWRNVLRAMAVPGLVFATWLIQIRIQGGHIRSQSGLLSWAAIQWTSGGVTDESFLGSAFNAFPGPLDHAPLFALLAVGGGGMLAALLNRSTKPVLAAVKKPFIVFAALLLLRALLPFSIAGYGQFLSIRFSTIALLSALAALPIPYPAPDKRQHRIFAGLIFSAALIATMAYERLYREFGREGALIEPIVQAIRADSVSHPRIWNLVIDKTSLAAENPQYLHAAAWVAARTDGIPSFSLFCEGRSYPISYRDDVKPGLRSPTKPIQAETEWEPWKIDYDSALASYDYVLMRNTGPVAAAFGSQYGDMVTLVLSSDEWYLFRTKRRVRP